MNFSSLFESYVFRGKGYARRDGRDIVILKAEERAECTLSCKMNCRKLA